MHIGKDNEKNDYKMNASLLTKCTNEKDLGIIFDETLNFDLHIQSVVNKANKMLGLIDLFLK